MTALVLALVVLAGLVLLALRREFARLERQRRLREFVRTSPDFAEMGRALITIRVTIRDNFTPALKSAAEAIARLSAAVDNDRPSEPPTRRDGVS